MAFVGEEFLVGAAFDDLAFFDDEDAIRGADGGEAVGDDEADPALEDGF